MVFLRKHRMVRVQIYGRFEIEAVAVPVYTVKLHNYDFPSRAENPAGCNCFRQAWVVPTDARGYATSKCEGLATCGRDV